MSARESSAASTHRLEHLFYHPLTTICKLQYPGTMQSKADAIEVEERTTLHLEESEPRSGKTEAERAFNLRLDGDNQAWTKEEERKLVRKLDILVIPLVSHQIQHRGSVTG